MVELFNRTWAELSTAAAADAGLDARYDHRSYELMGVAIEPQPTIGTAATALERKGLFTRKGDAVREIIVLSKAYELAHIEAMAAQRDQGLVDIAREAADATTAVTPVIASAQVPLEHKVAALSDRLPIRRRYARSPQADRVEDAPEAPGQVFADIRSVSDTQLTARFRATAPVPVTSTEHQTYERLLRILRVIERALRTLKSFAIALAQHENDRQRRMAAKLDTDSALDGSRANRTAADIALKQWEAAHPWKMMRARSFGDKSKMPRQWRELANEIQINHQHVQDFKATNRVHQIQLADLDGQGRMLKERQENVVDRLRTTVDKFAKLSPESVPPLLAALPDSDRYQVEALLPQITVEPRSGKVMDGPEFNPPGLHVRRSIRANP